MKRIFILLIFILILPTFIFCQKAKIDSLNTLLKNEKQDTAQARLLLALSNEYYFTLNDESGFYPYIPDSAQQFSQRVLILTDEALAKLPSPVLRDTILKHKAQALYNIGLYLNYKKKENERALEYFNNSLSIREKINDKKGIASTLFSIGFIYDTHQPQKAIEYYLKSISIREEIVDRRGVAQGLNMIGIQYEHIGKLKKSLDYSYKSLKIYEKIDDKNGVANCLNNIGFDYQLLKDYDQALEYFKKSLNVLRKSDNTRGIPYVLNGIGVVYKLKGDTANAMNNFKESLELHEKKGNKSGIPAVLQNIASIYAIEGNIPSAINYINKCLKICRELNDEMRITRAYNNFASVLFEQKNISLSRLYADSALSVSKEIGYAIGIRDAAELLSKIYKKQNKVDEANEMFALFVQMRDSVNFLRDVKDYFMLATKKKEKMIQNDSLRKKSTFHNSILAYPDQSSLTGYQVVCPANTSFYTNKKDTLKISSVSLNMIYTQYHQFVTMLSSNIWLNKHKINIVGDWRYYQFPTITYGLGSKTTLNNADTINYSHLRIHEVVTTKIFDNITVGAGWNYDYHFNITENKTENIVTDLNRYNNYTNNSSSVSSGVTVNFQYDSRLNSNNPDNGGYAFLQIRNNLKALGSDGNWQSLMLDARKYIQISRKSDNVLALWSYNYVTLSGIPPYFDLASLGEGLFNDVGRSYIANRFRGKNLVYLEAEYRFRLMKNGFLGGVLFSNASSFTEYPNGKFETIFPAVGCGLRIKMDKFSKTNACLDYSFAIDGSRVFAFQLNEVF